MNRFLPMLMLLLIHCQPGTTSSARKLQGKIGPAGGTLQGSDGTAFAGFALSIPAGALASETSLTVELADDNTPLPDLALGVGPQFSLAPDGLMLAQPATVTLPFYPDNVTHFGQGPADVKVWARDGDSWSLYPATGNTDQSVSIALSALTTAGAGVKLVLAAPLPCTAVVCSICANGANGFCIDSYGTPANPVPAGTPIWVTALATTSAVYYTQRYGEFACRYDVSSHNITYSQGTLAPAVLGPGGNMALDGDGSLWASLDKGGSAQFRFSGSSQLFDIGQQSLSILHAADGSLIRGLVKGQVERLAGSFRTLLPWPSDPLNLVTFYDPEMAALELTGDGYWVGWGVGGIQRFHADTLQPESGTFLRLPSPVWQLYSHPALGSDNSIAVMAFTANSVTGVFDTPNPLIGFGGGVFGQVTLPFSPLDMVGDGAGGLWLSSLGRAEIYFLGSRDDGRGLSSVSLSGKVPVQLIAVPDGSVIAVTSSGELLHVKRMQ
jgi:hypothetical protein